MMRSQARGAEHLSAPRTMRRRAGAIRSIDKVDRFGFRLDTRDKLATAAK